MDTVPMTPAAVVALKTLRALEITDRAQARAILADWCRPSPRLAPADIRTILATFPPDASTVDVDESRSGKDLLRARLREDLERSGLPVPDGVEGFGISGRNPGGTDGR